MAHTLNIIFINRIWRLCTYLYTCVCTEQSLFRRDVALNFLNIKMHINIKNNYKIYWLCFQVANKTSYTFNCVQKCMCWCRIYYKRYDFTKTAWSRQNNNNV